MTKTSNPKAIEVKRAYFDSEPMLATGWPNINAQMQNILSLAVHFGVEVVLPQPVEDQLMEHRIREYTRKQQSIISHMDELNKLTSTTDIAMAVPTKVAADRLREGLRAKWLASKQQFLTAPYTQKPSNEFFGMAVRQEQPFGDEGKGFQDAVIFLSACDHLRQNQVANAVFVSKDNDFGDPHIMELASQAGVEIAVIDLSTLESMLKKRMQAKTEQLWKEDQERLRETVQRQQDGLREFILSNVDVFPTMFKGLGVIYANPTLGPVRVIAARTPPFEAERMQGQVVNVSFDVQLDIETRRLVQMSRQPKSAKLGQILGSHGMYIPSEVVLPHFENDIQTLTVEVEASATAEAGGYKNITFVSVRLKDAPWDELLRQAGVKIKQG